MKGQTKPKTRGPAHSRQTAQAVEDNLANLLQLETGRILTGTSRWVTARWV